MDDQTLRAAYAALQREHANGADSLEPPEALLAAVEGRGTEEARLAILDRALATADGAGEVELLRALAANRRNAAGLRYWRGVTAVIAVAAALALVAVPAARQALRSSVGEAVRSAAPDAILREPPQVASPSDSRVFRWATVPGARSYALEILTAEGTVVFTTTTADTVATLPDDLRLQPDIEHRWWVMAEMADGTQRPSMFRRLVVRIP